MVLAGLGWVVFRSPDVLPRELVFELHYLGSVEYSFGLNFSRPAAPVLAQYFNFLNLGYDGYRDIMLENLKNARLLSRALELSGYYTVLSDIHRPASSVTAAAKAVGVASDMDAENYMPGLPVVSFRWTDEFQKQHPNLDQKFMQTLLRAKGWIVPSYNLCPDLAEVNILRVVCREDLSEDMVDQLVHDILSITESLTKGDSIEAHLEGAVNQKTKHEHKSHTNLRKHPHTLPEGSGTKGHGYAKQC